MLIYFKDPKGISGSLRYPLDTSKSIQQNIQNNFPKGFDYNVTDIYLNGEKIDPLEYELNRKSTVFDDIRIINRQQGSIYTGIMIVVALVASVASFVLTPKPKVPNATGQQKDSSNNKLTAQTNIARLYQTKPDIYGCIRSYPDLVKPAGSEYIDNIKYIDHLMCIGIGKYQLEQFKYSETLLDNITGTEYIVYEPGDTIPIVRYQYASDEVNGQELTSPNLSDEVIHRNDFGNFIAYSQSGNNVTITLNKNSDISYYQDLILPTQLEYIVNADITAYSTLGGFKYYNSDLTYRGSLTNVQIDSDGYPVLTIAAVSFVKYNQSVYGNIASTTINSNKLIIVRKGGVYTDAFPLPEIGTEIQVDVAFQRGLQGYVSLRFIYWQIDDDGNEIQGTRQSKDWNISKNTYEPQNYSIKITDLAPSKYSVICARLNDGNSELTDQVKVENIFICSYEQNLLVKDTLIYIKTKATSQATGLKELKFNVQATRKTITYDRKNGIVDYSLRPSRSFADAVLHQFIEVYGRRPEELDLDSLYEINDRLNDVDSKLGYFDFSFDDIDISLGQRIESACNVARVFVYRDGQKWRFARNEEKNRPVAMFNSLNLVKNDEGGTIQKKSNLPSSYDGIQLEYVDSSHDRIGGTDKKAYINLKIKQNNIVEGNAFRPYKIELAGCRNYSQAMNRAQLEIRRLIYERTFIEDEAIQDANLIDKGDLALWVDSWDETVISGEVTKVDGHRFHVDQILELDLSKKYRVAITNKGGYPGNWTEITHHDNKSFTAEYNDAYTADNSNIQMGSIFIITETVCDEPTEFLLTNKEYHDGVFKIKLTNYDKRIYEYDRESGFFIS